MPAPLRILPPRPDLLSQINSHHWLLDQLGALGLAPEMVPPLSITIDLKREQVRLTGTDAGGRPRTLHNEPGTMAVSFFVDGRLVSFDEWQEVLAGFVIEELELAEIIEQERPRPNLWSLTWAPGEIRAAKER